MSECVISILSFEEASILFKLGMHDLLRIIESDGYSWVDYFSLDAIIDDMIKYG